ncbi:MAG: CRISPR-associated helicase Cas3' [Myxococcota bacterium]
MEFPELFRGATGYDPYPYQIEFAESEKLPDLLRAPTGAGKTATAVLGWLWRRRFASSELRSSTPRRLVFCLPMRSLVSQTVNATQGWLKQLGLLDDVGLHSLMGGAVSVDWEMEPERDSILVGTQDQLLSRALNRGYGMSRFRWPVHFALLNNDVLWVMDEIQLMGVGLSTSAQLQGFSHATYGSRTSVWMSATLDERKLATIDLRGQALTTQDIQEADRTHEKLQPRLESVKRLYRASVEFNAKDDAYARELAPFIVDRHAKNNGRTIVIVNRVARAIAVVQRLRRTTSGKVVVLHSRFRPPDRQAVAQAALDKDFDGIVVATQAIEAGVDLTCSTMITELAPWPSLVQRFGRCNRYGEVQSGADIYWVDLPGNDKVAPPYTAEEFEHARSLLLQHQEVGPARLKVGHPAFATPTGPVLRRRDLQDLFDNTSDLSGFDIDVSRFIRDDGGPEVQVAWRDWSGTKDRPPGLDDPTEGRNALARDELCRVPVAAFEQLTRTHAWWMWDPLASTSDGTKRRGSWVRGRRVVPGSTVLLRTAVGGYHVDPEDPSQSLGFTGTRTDRPPVVVVHKPIPVEADDDDPDALIKKNAYIRLQDHALDVRDHAESLSQSLIELDSSLPWAAVVLAAHWHDLGKVHPAWQAMITSHHSFPDSGPWAKRPLHAPSPIPNPRKHFRHELASALAYLQHEDPDDLVAYLIAAHHGKVRMAIRSRPGETPDSKVLSELGLAEDAEVRLALGVYDGEVLPATDLGGGLTTQEVSLDLSVMALGGGSRASWVERVLILMEQHGPYRLAFLETLVRIADWRASGHPSRFTPPEVNHDA